MKRTILFATILLLICSIAAATAIKKGIVTVINAVTYTAVVNTGPGCSDFAVWTENGTSYYYAVDSAGSGEILVPADTFISFPNSVPSGDTAMWVKASAATPNFVFQPGK
jgi:hypothetical protein